MALKLGDRVRETTATTGTGNITLGGAVSGFISFSSVLSNADTTFYAIIFGNQWEVGIGTYVSASNIIQRTTVLSSSNSGSLVDFTSGTKNIIITQPAERAVYVDGLSVAAANSATVPNSLLANSTITINGVTIALGGSSSVVPAPNPLVNYTLTTPTITGGTLTDNITQGTVVTANSAFDALRVTQTGAGNSFVVEDAFTPDGSPFVITANGSVVAGYTSTINAGGAVNPKLQVLGTTSSLSTISSGIYSADTTPASYFFLKSRSAALGTNTIVQSGDQIGQIVFSGADGTTFIPAASIVAEVDGTPGTSDMPGRLLFKTTADGAATATTAVTIDNAQRVGIGVTPTAVLMLKAGTATASTAPLKFTSGTILTTAEAGVLEYDGTAFYADIAASTRTTIVAQQSVILNNTYTLSSITAAQKLFNNTANGAITLPVGTYFFECFYSLASMSATSGSFGFALGGAATFTQQWRSEAQKGTATLATATATQATFSTTANTTLATASVNTVGFAFICGVINVTVTGTVIPQVSLGIAASAIVGIGSYFKINAVSPANNITNVTVGNWS
jgi:hypothetical protein